MRSQGQEMLKIDFERRNVDERSYRLSQIDKQSIYGSDGSSHKLTSVSMKAVHYCNMFTSMERASDVLQLR